MASRAILISEETSENGLRLEVGGWKGARGASDFRSSGLSHSAFRQGRRARCEAGEDEEMELNYRIAELIAMQERNEVERLEVRWRAEAQAMAPLGTPIHRQAYQRSRSRLPQTLLHRAKEQASVSRRDCTAVPASAAIWH